MQIGLRRSSAKICFVVTGFFQIAFCHNKMITEFFENLTRIPAIPVSTCRITFGSAEILCRISRFPSGIREVRHDIREDTKRICWTLEAICEETTVVAKIQERIREIL